MLTVLQAFINGIMTPSKLRPISPKLTHGQEQSFDCPTIRIVPPPAPQRIISPLLLPSYLPEDAVIEEDDEEWDEGKSDSIGGSTDSVITRPNPNQQEQQDGSKGKTTTTSGKITDFNCLLDDPGHSRRQQQTAVIKPISSLLIPNELSVFGPSSRMKPFHKIRQIMITREGGRGLGPNRAREHQASTCTINICEMRVTERTGISRRFHEIPWDSMPTPLSEDSYCIVIEDYLPVVSRSF